MDGKHNRVGVSDLGFIAPVDIFESISYFEGRKLDMATELISPQIEIGLISVKIRILSPETPETPRDAWAKMPTESSHPVARRTSEH